METLIKHANGQWTLEELSKAKPATTPSAAVPTATPTPSPNQGHLGEYWKAPVKSTSQTKPGPALDYKAMNAVQPKPESPALDYAKMNQVKQGPQSDSIDYSKLTKPKPSVENIAQVKSQPQEDKSKDALPPKTGIEEMEIRRGQNEIKRQVAESIVTGKPIKKK